MLNARGGVYPSDRPHMLILGPAGDSVRLDHDRGLALSAVLYYQLVEATDPIGSWTARPTAYYYALEDLDGREVLAYHWHPEAQGQIAFPHLHLGAGAAPQGFDLVRVHLPTGQISLEAVLRLAITDFGVHPRRPDWDEILRQSQETTERSRA